MTIFLAQGADGRCPQVKLIFLYRRNDFYSYVYDPHGSDVVLLRLHGYFLTTRRNAREVEPVWIDAVHLELVLLLR